MSHPSTRTRAILLIALLLAVLPKQSLAQPPPPSATTNYSVSGPEVENYRLTITTSNKTHAAGQLVPLEISLDNLSTNAADISAGTGFMYYSLKVADPGGRPAPMTAYGTNALFPTGYSLFSRHVPPGKSCTAYAALNFLFNMTNTGEYTVTAARQVPKRSGPYKEVWVRAGPLKITITEPEKKP